MNFFGMTWKPSYLRTRKGNGQLDTIANLAFERTYAPPMGDVAGRGGFVAGSHFPSFFRPLVIVKKGVTLGDIDGYGLLQSGDASRNLSPLSLDQKGKSGI